MPTWTPAQECAMKLRGRDVLVSAAAGSGKTATLTERIIRSLTEVDADGRHTGDISRMLIVTFTRAAAAELRARISSALSAAIAAHPDDKYLYRQLVALGSADICTIDAFYLGPVRANFERLGLPSTFRLADDTELQPIKEQLLNRLIEEAYEAAADHVPDPDAPLDALAGNAFAKAMDDLLPNRDRGDTATILLKLFDKLLSFPEGLELLRMGADRLRREAERPFGETAEGKTLSASICEEMEYDIDILRPMCTSLLMDLDLEKNYLPSFAHDLSTAEQILADLRAGLWESAAARAEAYAPIPLKRVPKTALCDMDLEVAKKARTDITNTLRSLKSRYFADSPEEMSRQMLHTARTQRMLYTLLTDYDRAIKEEKNRRGVLDFADVRRYLLELILDKDGNPTDVGRSLSDRYDAVYIDEYQDVDAVQDLIFSTIGQGGKRFMVGDIKQSIYGFRGAAPSIFAGYRKAFVQVEKSDELPPAPHDDCCVFMSENFRCDRSIVHFTNAVCSHVFSACADSIGYQPKDDLVYGKGKDRPSCPVEAVFFEFPPKAQRTPDDDPTHALNPEAVWIADKIDAMRREETLLDGRPIRPRDVAVLMRSMTAAPDLVEALRAHGIRASFAASDSLLSDPAAMTLINLLSVIDNPRDDVPLTGLLTGEASPFSLSDLITLRRPDKSTSLYDDILAALEEEPFPDPQLKARLASFVSHLDRWRALSTTLPVDRLLRRLSAEPVLGIDATSPAYLVLYDKALSYQASSFCGLYQFMQYLRRLLKDPTALSAEVLQASEDAVTILTIHKAKGLQFPVVFVCSCGTDFNTDDLYAPVMFDPELGAAAKIFLPETAESRETVTRRAIARRLKVRQTEEEMRLLYVALTRAQERLLITARLPSTFASAQAKAQRPGVRTRHSILSTLRYIDWILPDLEGNDVAIRSVNREDYRHPHPLPDAASEQTEKTRIGCDGAEYRAILERHQAYDDPHTMLRTLPTKAAASKLRTAMLDHTWLAEEFGGENGENKSRAEDTSVSTDTESAIRRRIELMQSSKPSFSELLERDHSASPAERGTATHLFLQHCDFSRLADTGLEHEIERLVREQFMSRRAADILNHRHLEAFCGSDLCRLARKARHVWRELHFDRFVPYATLTQNQELARRLEDYTLYVQGSIDLIMEDAQGELWLFDYKTDRLLTDSERVIKAQFLEHHGEQLRIYREAARELFGRAPDHVCIYSLPLGRSIELTELL